MNYDVFLSHSHEDAELIENLAIRLEDEAGLKVWLDQWELIPGKPWLQAMALGLDQASSCAVFFGSATPEGWFQREYSRALNRQSRNSEFGVIPVLVRGGNPQQVGDFLELNTWVDFRNGLADDVAFQRLVAGIKGESPGRATSLLHPEHQQNNFLKSCYFIASEIFERADRALRENQDALIPLLTGTQSLKQVQQRMLEIFHGQQSRGFFKIRSSYLKKKIEMLDQNGENELRLILIDLEENVDKLIDIFYSVENQNFQTKSEIIRKITIMKNMAEEAPHTIEMYLNILRECVESIGNSVGVLRAMSE